MSNTNSNSNRNLSQTSDLNLQHRSDGNNFIHNVTSYFSGIIPWNSKSILDSWDTTVIDNSLGNRLHSADKYLNKLGSLRADVQKNYDIATIRTKNIEAQYNNNIACIDAKVKDIRIQVISFSDNISNLDVDSSSNEDTLTTLSNIFDFTEKLRFKIGEEKLFKHIDVQGLSVFTNYYKAIELNKHILEDIAHSKEQEVPLEKKLLEIDALIEKISKEVDLIKKFKIEHTKIITENKGPAVTGKVELLLDTMTSKAVVTVDTSDGSSKDSGEFSQ